MNEFSIPVPQIADLEAAAAGMVLLESRAEAAEGERDDALEQLRAATPRPQQSWGELAELLGEAGAVAKGCPGLGCCKGFTRAAGMRTCDQVASCDLLLHSSPTRTCLLPRCRPAALPGGPGGAQALAH